MKKRNPYRFNWGESIQPSDDSASLYRSGFQVITGLDWDSVSREASTKARLINDEIRATVERNQRLTESIPANYEMNVDGQEINKEYDGI